MNTQLFNQTYTNISQRVAISHLKSLAALVAAPPEGQEPGQTHPMERAQRALNTFFRTLYEAMAQSPESFGLPLSADINLPRERDENRMDLQEANRRLSKTRAGVDALLDFLMAVGCAARQQAGMLTLTPAEFAACQVKPKLARKFIPGLALAGLEISESKDQVALASPRYPDMLPALQALALGCAQYNPANLARFHFARCDFRALTPGYTPDVLDLFQVFRPDERVHLANLHAFFLAHGYRANLQIAGVYAWLVQYQGNRKIKASPLYQVEYQDRFNNPLMVQIKCASANRITALVSRQSPALQADFFQRSLRCRGDECNWCATRKGMAPSVLVYNGEEFSTCWYVPPDVSDLTEESVALIKEYALMHEALLN